MSYPQPAHSAVNDEAGSRRALRNLSMPLIVLAAAAFAGGLIAGLISYLDRSPVLQKHIAGAAAWPQQLVVAVLAAALLGYAYWWHHRSPGRPGEPPWLLSPLGKPAARRLARTFRTGLGGSAAFGRAVLALALGGLFLYGFYRAGDQVTAGLDPNFNVNAWGGPTYAGAMAAHYLDLLVIMGAAAWLLHLILPPDPANEAAGGAVPLRPATLARP